MGLVRGYSGPWERVMDGNRLCGLSDEVTISGLYFFFNGRVLVILFLRKMFIYSVASVLAAAGRIMNRGRQALTCVLQDLAVWPGMECRPPALGAWSLSH